MKEQFIFYKPLIHSFIAFLFQLRVGDKYQPDQCYNLTKYYVDKLQSDLPTDDAKSS